eukprot:3243244-Rhodomonas_salina.1
MEEHIGAVLLPCPVLDHGEVLTGGLSLVTKSALHLGSPSRTNVTQQTLDLAVEASQAFKRSMGVYMQNLLQGMVGKFRHCRESKLVSLSGIVLSRSVTIHWHEQKHVVLLDDGKVGRLALHPEQPGGGMMSPDEC